MDRRQFLQLTACATLSLGLGGCTRLGLDRWGKPRRPRPIGLDGVLRIAQIGLNGKGDSDLRDTAVVPNVKVTALCDVDWGLDGVNRVFERHPDARRFKDFREMLLEMDDEIDAVIISTPDHMHFLPAFMAISMGKHVYVQKPLTQTIAEARALRELARRHGVVTQMGNQGHAGDGTRRVREWVQSGTVGEVREVHIWTDRPGNYWKQDMTAYPPGSEPPATLDWDLWVGRAPHHAYSSAIHPFHWRGWRDYGCGALGDMGCHIMDASFYALDLDAPTLWIEAETSPVNDVAFPEWSIVTWHVPQRGNLPPVTVKWYDGGKKQPRPVALEAEREFNSPGGQYLVGSRSTILDVSDYCNSPRLTPLSHMREIGFAPETIERVPEGNPHREWIDAIRNGTQPGGNFEYSARLTEFVLLGNLAVLAQQPIEWDARRMRARNVSVDHLIEPTYRKGWETSRLL